MTSTLTAVRKKEKVLSAVDFNLYLITDRRLIEGKPLLEALEEALKGGVKAIQLREKDLSTRDFLDIAYRLRNLTLKYDARLFINDRVDVAIAVDADGVHLGKDSIPPYAVRRASRRLIVGVSTHNLDEAINAEKNGADYIVLGPVYPTASKQKFGKPIGVKTIKLATEYLSVPVFAIGGINLENLKEVMSSGADGVALISAIFASKNIRGATAKFVRMLQ